MGESLFDAWGGGASEIFILALNEKRRAGREKVTAGDFVIGVRREGRSAGALALRDAGLSAGLLRQALGVHPIPSGGLVRKLPDLEILLSNGIADALADTKVNGGHVLLGMLMDAQVNAALETLGTDEDRVRASIYRRIYERRPASTRNANRWLEGLRARRRGSALKDILDRAEAGWAEAEHDEDYQTLEDTRGALVNIQRRRLLASVEGVSEARTLLEDALWRVEHRNRKGGGSV